MEKKKMKTKIIALALILIIAVPIGISMKIEADRDGNFYGKWTHSEYRGEVDGEWAKSSCKLTAYDFYGDYLYIIADFTCDSEMEGVACIHGDICVLYDSSYKFVENTVIANLNFGDYTDVQMTGCFK